MTECRLSEFSHKASELTHDVQPGRGRRLSAGVGRLARVAGAVVDAGFADLESTRPVDLRDDVVRAVVDVFVVLEPRHGRRGYTRHVTLEHELRALGYVRGLEVLGEVWWDDLLVRLCGYVWVRFGHVSGWLASQVHPLCGHNNQRNQTTTFCADLFLTKSLSELRHALFLVFLGFFSFFLQLVRNCWVWLRPAQPHKRPHRERFVFVFC